MGVRGRIEGMCCRGRGRIEGRIKQRERRGYKRKDRRNVWPGKRVDGREAKTTEGGESEERKDRSDV